MLYDKYGPRPIYDLGMGANMKIWSFIQNGSWLFPTPTSADMMQIFHSIRTLGEPNLEFDDEVIWKNGEIGKFSIKGALNQPGQVS